VRRLPVVDKLDMLVGILSIDDLLLRAQKRPPKGGISYEEAVEAAKMLLQERKKEHKKEAAELLAVKGAGG
jgi:hypothetical protein